MTAMKPKTTVRRILSAVWLHTVETAGREKAAVMSPKYELPHMSEVRAYGFKYSGQVLAIKSNASA
ncbi:TPA: hypothetical protein ACLAL1_000632 [Neisseria meningitidis]